MTRLVEDEQVDDGTSALITQVLHGQHKHQQATAFWNDMKGVFVLTLCKL